MKILYVLSYLSKNGGVQSVVNNYCTGKREPTLSVLVEICKTLNESADYLLGLDDWH